MNKLIKGDSLSDKAYAFLCDMIHEMRPGKNKLPSEDELSDMMGVSRATVREALKRLMLGGYVTSVHGKGTFAHPSLFKAKNRIDLYTDFSALLEKQYENVTVDVEHLGVIQSSERFCRTFHSSPIEVYGMIWRYSAAGIPMLYGAYEFPLQGFRRMPDPMDDVQDLVAFSKRYLLNRIACCSMKLGCGQDARIAAQLGLPPETTLLSWEEVILNIKDYPVGFATCYVHPENMEMTVVAHFDTKENPGPELRNNHQDKTRVLEHWPGR